MLTSQGCSGTQGGQMLCSKGTSSGSSPQFSLFQAVWPWVSHCTSLNLSFLTCQMRITAAYFLWSR